MSYIDAIDFIHKISEELCLYNEKYHFLLHFYIFEIPTIKDRNININQINTTIDIMQEIFLNRDDINDNEKDNICLILNKFKIII